ncbi:MAG: hypothetical protein M3442_08930 [Chloroflexota bacterium]|nr:hypothetical protein [Chloroflexota bacterium]
MPDPHAVPEDAGNGHSDAPIALRHAWRVAEAGEELRIAYGPGGAAAHVPQLSVLHRRDGFLRLAPDGTVWGTSVVLPPALWLGSHYGDCYVQGAPVTTAWRVVGDSLVLTLAGAVADLRFAATVRLAPPINGRVTAGVRLRTIGAAVPMASRPGEAAKLVTLSSMRVSRTRWDARAALLGDRQTGDRQIGDRLRPVPLPAPRTGGWLLPNPAVAHSFGLLGGDSAWKHAAPTVTVQLDRPLAVTGWLTPSRDPNDDNLSMWAAADAFPPAWAYTLTAQLPDVP